MPTEALGEGRLIEASARYSPPAYAPSRAGARKEPQCVATLRFFSCNNPRNRRNALGTRAGMNPEIRAILFGLLIAVLACPKSSSCFTVLKPQSTELFEFSEPSAKLHTLLLTPPPRCQVSGESPPLHCLRRAAS
jgi:hypothetical protein